MRVKCASTLTLWFACTSLILDLVLFCMIACFDLPITNQIDLNENQSQEDTQSFEKDFENLDCCKEPIIIDSLVHPHGFLKVPQIYEKLNNTKHLNRKIECLYKFYGKPGERVQLFYEDFDLYYPYDIQKFNKIDCRYADSICVKFYEHDSTDSISNIKENSHLSKTVSLESHNYDICNCINVSFTPRQIMSANNYLQVRFKTVPRHFEGTSQSNRMHRGYLIRFRFTTENGIDTKEGGELDTNINSCKIYFSSILKSEGYFSSPNYPGLYPRDTECHYYFNGQKDERIQITFHTFDVEGVEQCRAETKSDYVELSNFQNPDRFYSRFCGVNKPISITSDGNFFHITFYSNNVFDGKGFQASYQFISSNMNNKYKLQSKEFMPSIQQIATSDVNIKNGSQMQVKSINNAPFAFLVLTFITFFNSIAFNY